MTHGNKGTATEMAATLTRKCRERELGELLLYRRSDCVQRSDERADGGVVLLGDDG